MVVIFYCRYSQAFDGVVLAYSVDPQDNCAKILSGVHPYFGVRLRANLLIFSPKPNMLLGCFFFCFFMLFFSLLMPVNVSCFSYTIIIIGLVY